ncbi:hypothetical protein [Actinocatenispora rupis]|uniref:Uncharacterized protein n=1 Tax=Actinocatenispora rupis TaxID=519421 RepID=A0A8J3J8S4_9ACTN|nr:hypothetical protein [Actinocatenispora rupis]GID14012.1 hypothetical protein Aru02nite_49010 [Actinocatenispora rupis]
MTYPPMPPSAMPPPQQPGPGERPTTVTAAGGLQMFTVLLSLVTAALALVAMPKLTAAYDTAGVTDTGTFKSIMKVSQVGSMVFYILLAVLIVFLVLGNLRGKQGTRIASFVVSGLYVLCGICGALGTATGAGTSGGVDIYAAIPWYRWISLLLTILLLLAHGGVIVLLALKPSTEFFTRNKAAAQQPPVPPAQQYPPYPGAF